MQLNQDCFVETVKMEEDQKVVESAALYVNSRNNRLKNQVAFRKIISRKS